MTAVFMPLLEDCALIAVDEPANHVEFVRTETVIPGERERLKPEFARLVLALDVSVGWFVAIEAGEEEPIWPRDVLDFSAFKVYLRAVVTIV